MASLTDPRYKVVVALYEPAEHFFKIPAHWQLDDVFIKWGNLYYKDEEMNVPNQLNEPSYNRPIDIDFKDYDAVARFFLPESESETESETESDGSESD